MSRAFVKEGGAEPPLVVPRAPLASGTPNYVTRRGLALLHDERAALEASRPAADDPAGAAALAGHNARLAALEERVASAVTVDVAAIPHDEVRFSALVTLRNSGGAVRQYRIVGVDEADASKGLISFRSPMAQTVLNATQGDLVEAAEPLGEIEIISISS